MSDLRLARHMMNAKVRQELDSVDIFDPASLDDEPAVSLPVSFTFADEVLNMLDGGRETIVSGGVAPALSWEIVL